MFIILLLCMCMSDAHVIIKYDKSNQNLLILINYHFYCQIFMVSGWQPIDIGPRSLEEMANSLSECKVLKYC